MIKKILSVFTVFALTLSMCLVVNGAQVTVDPAFDGHTFKIYKILSGTQSEGDNSGALADVEWVNDTFGEYLLDVLKVDPTVVKTAPEQKTVADYFPDNVDTAKEFAEVLSNNPDVSEKLARVVAKSAGFMASTGILTEETTVTAGATVNLDPGYYLIVDVTDSTHLGENDAINSSLLQVTGKGNIDISKKTSMPTLIKKVQENHSYVTNGGWNDVANYFIGDSVPFKVSATIDNLTYFDTYKAVITDTLGDGFDLPQAGNITVKINGTILGTDDNPYQADDGVSINIENREVIVTLANLKNYVSGEVDNVEIEVTYSAVLNKSANIGTTGNENKAKLTYSYNPNMTLNTERDTVEDKVVVYTMSLEIKKVDSNNQDVELSGAQFKLQRKTDDKYAQIDDNGFITGWVDDVSVATPYEINRTHKEIKGIDTGTYYLYETKAPDGYETPRSDSFFEVIVTPDVTFGDNYNGTSVFTNLAVTINKIAGDKELGPDVAKAKITIGNTKGGILPETGGIGTTLFYIIGGLLVVGAGVVLVSKKRLERNNNK